MEPYIKDLTEACYLGMDPEGFIVKGGVPFPAHMVGLPDKANPARLPGYSGKVLRDGYAVEFNPFPEHCRGLLDGNLRHSISGMRRKYLRKHWFAQLIFKSAMKIDLATLEGSPRDVCEFGCEGAWNAYVQSIVKPTIHGRTHEWRYTGGHMHGSFGMQYVVPWAKSMEDTFLLIKILDRYVGLFSTYLTGSEFSKLRREYYGQAGEFRIQPHPHTIAAIEYRTPGSEIMSHNALSSLCFGVFREILENYPCFAEVYDPAYEEQARQAIDNGISDPDLLDLIPELQNWYDKKVLRKAKKFFAPYLWADQFSLNPGNSRRSNMMRGWGEVARRLGFDAPYIA